MSSANIGAGNEGYRAGGGLGKCKSWSLSIQGWWWVLQVKKLVAKHMELEVKTTSTVTGRECSRAGGAYCKYRS